MLRLKEGGEVSHADASAESISGKGQTRAQGRTTDGEDRPREAGVGEGGSGWVVRAMMGDCS